MGTPATSALLGVIRPLCVVLFALLIARVPVDAQSRDYVVLQVPGCQSTIPWAVNERGDVVGNALSCAAGVQDSAFLYRQGVYSAIDVPGAAITIPTDINDRGSVVGYFRAPTGELGAFTLWRGEYQSLRVPGVDLVPQGINNRGDITGWMPTPESYQAFLLAKDGVFTILTGAGDLEGLQAWKINSSGLIVGSAFSPTRGPASFLYRRGESSIAELPGIFYAVNDRGDVAAEIPGSGFVVYRQGAPLELNHPETSYTIFDLSNRWAVGALGGGSGYLLRLP
jgi:uncharacterized membrane protein